MALLKRQRTGGGVGAASDHCLQYHHRPLLPRLRLVLLRRPVSFHHTPQIRPWPHPPSRQGRAVLSGRLPPSSGLVRRLARTSAAVDRSALAPESLVRLQSQDGTLDYR